MPSDLENITAEIAQRKAALGDDPHPAFLEKIAELEKQLAALKSPPQPINPS